MTKRRSYSSWFSLSIVALMIVAVLVMLVLIGLNTVSAAAAAVCDTVTEIPASECAALEALYQATDGPNWSLNGGWLEDDTPCDWVGITCAGGHVTRIELASNGLNGQLPAAVGDLVELQVLLLGTNLINGSIPVQLGQLSELSRLDFSGNLIEGSIPTTFGQLSNLTELSLGRNGLTGNIPLQLGDLDKLVTLDLVSNKLEGNIPETLGDLDNITWIDLGDNKLTGRIPKELGIPVDLTSLFVDSNKLWGAVPPELCDNLFFTNLGYNRLSTAAADPCFDLLFTDTWKSTQTVPPTGLTAATLPNGDIVLDWNAVDYIADDGYFEIYHGVSSGGPYDILDQSPVDKSSTTITLTGVKYTSKLFFVIRTVNPANTSNQSRLASLFSEEAPVTTTPLALELEQFQVKVISPWILALVSLILVGFTAALIINANRRAT